MRKRPGIYSNIYILEPRDENVLDKTMLPLNLDQLSAIPRLMIREE